MRISKSVFLPAALLPALLLVACGDQSAPATPDTDPPARPDVATATEDEPPADGEAEGRRLTPERIAEIRASGRTGIWSEIPALCAGEHAKAMIGWNVEASGVDTVAVYLVGSTGNERLFAQGSPVGEKSTGNWLKPGMVFKVRAKDDERELASLEITERQDCAAQ